MNNDSSADISASTAQNEPHAEVQSGSKSQSRDSTLEQEVKTKQSKNYTASIYPGHDSSLPPLPPQLGVRVLKLEKQMDMPVWLLLQNGGGKYGDIGESVRDEFFSARSTLIELSKKGKKIALM